MTNNELELLTIIQQDENPREAAMIAIGIIYDYLKKPSTYQEQYSAYLEELA